MPVLPVEWRLHLPLMPSLRLGGCDSQGQPHVCRALAADALPDGRMLVLFAERAAPRVAAALRKTSQVAFLATSPRTNRTLHIKGRDTQVEPALPEHMELLRQRGETLAKEISEIDGFRGDVLVQNWYGIELHDLLAARFTIYGAWDQTPGPEAGQPLALEPTP